MSPSPSPPPTPLLRFALVGCGAIATTQAQAIKALPELLLLTHCADLDENRATEFASKHGLTVASWADLLTDPAIDAISLCIPSGLHGSLAAEAFHAGKHVVIEKPMEISVAACDALITAQQTSGRKLAVISQHRFDPASGKVRALLDEGALGRLIGAEVRIPWYRTQEYYDSGDWRGTWAQDGGGCLMNQGIHTVDLMLWFCGPVHEVFARAVTAAHKNIEVEDIVCATLTFANGIIATLFASTASYPGFPASLSLYGTEGSAVINGDELQTLAIQGAKTVSGSNGSAHAQQVASGGTRSAVQHASAPPLAVHATDSPAEIWKWGDAHRAQFADFAAAVRNDREPLVNGHSGRAAVALIQAVYESSRTGLAVRLDC